MRLRLAERPRSSAHRGTRPRNRGLAGRGQWAILARPMRTVVAVRLAGYPERIPALPSGGCHDCGQQCPADRQRGRGSWSSAISSSMSCSSRNDRWSTGPMSPAGSSSPRVGPPLPPPAGSGGSGRVHRSSRRSGGTRRAGRSWRRSERRRDPAGGPRRGRSDGEDRRPRHARQRAVLRHRPRRLPSSSSQAISSLPGSPAPTRSTCRCTRSSTSR